eukprot:160695-Pleurochrysis_carterae.AAC.1
MGSDAYPCRWMALHADGLVRHGHAAVLRHRPYSYGKTVRQRCYLIIDDAARDGADLNGTASGVPTDLRFDR